MRNRFLAPYALISGLCLQNVGLIPILISSVVSFVLSHVTKLVYRWWTKPRFPDLELIDKLDAIRMQYYLSLGKVEIKPKGTEKQRQKQLVKRFKEMYRAFYEDILQPLKRSNIDVGLYCGSIHCNIGHSGNLKSGCINDYVRVTFEKFFPFGMYSYKDSSWLMVIQEWPSILEKAQIEYKSRINSRQSTLEKAELAMRDMERSA